MKCKKCRKEIKNGFDWDKGEYTGVKEGVCEECWTARIDSMVTTIRNAPAGPMTALLALDFCNASEERKKEIENGAELTEAERALAINRAKESGHLDQVSKYTLALT